MTIGVEVYTKRNPNPLLKILKESGQVHGENPERVTPLRNIGNPENMRTYLLALTGNQKQGVRLSLSTQPMHYRLNVSPQSEREYLRREGIKESQFVALPETLRSKAEREMAVGCLPTANCMKY